jgi:phenylalanyl-tRNA synthetase beta chain
MRVSLNWLKELVDINLAPEELGQILTIAGFEVEEIEDLRTFADGVVVGKVLKRDRHPDADKLSVCQVDIGTETPLSIVCGAANVRADLYVPVATVGTYLPAVDLKLKPTKLRGVPSEGMICSLAELGLEKQSEGIHIFSGALQPGADVRPLLGLDDVILDLATTANRADALSMVGIAREVAALTGAKIKLPEVRAINLTANNSLKITVTGDRACSAYIGTVIEGVKIAPSPEWLQWRIIAGGVRPINNVVDITNYVLLEWGQPLHAFDRDKLQQVARSEDLTIGIRFATEGEKLKTLDEKERQLVTQNLLITANEQPVALAGVMGGADTEVDNSTVNLVLEAALFDPVAIRRSSRAQGLRSEASTRYERGVNQVELESACDRAISLLQELAGGNPVAKSLVDGRANLDTINTIELRLSRIHHLLGQVKTETGTSYISKAEVETILTALGCQLTPSTDKTDTWQVRVPPYRYRDLEREVDLIEEVARLYRYDRFCETLPEKTEPGYLSVEYQTLNRLRQALRGVGLTELVHYSLVKPTQEEVTLANPLFAEYSALRKDLISGLITAFEYNQSQGNGGLNGFEIGRVFWKTEAGIAEGDRVAGIMGGAFYPQGIWTTGGKPTVLSWYEAKGILDSVFNSLGLDVTYRADSSDNRFHPGRTAALWLEGKQLGIFGQLHPELVKQRDLIKEVYVFELTFEQILTALNRDKLTTPKFQTYANYPSSQRDLAFFAPVDLTVAEIANVISKTGGKLLEKVELFDEYKGQNVPEGQRSLAFNLVYRAGDRTLQDKDVDPVHQKIRDTLVKKFAVTLRS